jgi:hypothetical protein
MPKSAPHAHQVRLRELATGRVFLAWPVDAREMLTHPNGGFEVVTNDTPIGTPDPEQTHSNVSPAPVASPTPTIAERLQAKSYKELQVLAKRANVNAVGKKAEEIVASLVPLVESGVVSLEEIPKLAIDPVQFPNATPE